MENDRKARTRFIRRLILILIPYIALCICLGSYAIYSIVDEDTPSEKIEKHLGVKLPNHAQNIYYNREIVRIRFSFDAPPEEMEKFVEAFCPLYPGYDAFNAVDKRNNLNDTVLVGAYSDTYHLYYSHSLGVSDKIWGNRCSEKQGLYIVKVDKTKSQLYTLRYENPFGECGLNSANLPCGNKDTSYIHPRKLPFPVMVVGLDQSGEDIALISKTICIDAEEAFYFQYFDYTPFIGSEVDIFIDNVHKSKLYLFGVRRLEDVNSPTTWNCYTEDWQEGEHELRFIVTTPDGTTFEDTIRFTASYGDEQ